MAPVSEIRYVTVDARKYITIYVEKYYGSDFVGICLGQDGDNRKQVKTSDFLFFLQKKTILWDH